MRLDSNLFPVRFANGGESDIVYKYADGHDVLIEVTMSNKEAQQLGQVCSDTKTLISSFTDSVYKSKSLEELTSSIFLSSKLISFNLFAIIINYNYIFYIITYN